MTKTTKDIMTTKVEWLKPDAKLTDVAKKMAESDCGSILIGEGDKLVGVVTDHDIAVRAIAKGLNPAETTAKQIMSPKVLYCLESDTVDAVAQNMAKNQVRRLVVLDAKKRMVGIISLGDVSGAATTSVGKALSDICSSSVSKAA